MKTRIQSITWAMFFGMVLSLLLTSCQKESFLNLEPEKTAYQSDRIGQALNVEANPEVVAEASATDAVLPVQLRVNCRIMTILYKPNGKIQVYKCKGEDLHTQQPVEINGKRYKSYQTGEVRNNGVVSYPNGAFRMDQVGGAENGNLDFTLTGISGTMAGIAGSGTWFDPKQWLAGNTLFEGTLQ